MFDLFEGSYKNLSSNKINLRRLTYATTASSFSTAKIGRPAYMTVSTGLAAIG
jgi:hypothetical protein